MAAPELPSFARGQLRNLVQSIWGEVERERAGVRFAKHEVMVSVKGGKVVYGGAPLDLILTKVEEIRALLYRTVEMMAGVRHRKRGSPSREIQQYFQPWLFHAPAGSYQFAVRLQEPEQILMFREPMPNVDEVTGTFMQILRALATDPEEALPALVADAEYQNTFLSLARGLAPHGESFERLEVRTASDSRDRGPLVMTQGSRERLNSTMKKRAPKLTPHEETERSYSGVLRAVHLDEDWLEVAIEENGEERRLKVIDAGEAVDDVVGPMVNRRVIVDVAVGRGERLRYRDIQLEG